jgi:hypothetical protein
MSDEMRSSCGMKSCSRLRSRPVGGVLMHRRSFVRPVAGGGAARDPQRGCRAGHSARRNLPESLGNSSPPCRIQLHTCGDSRDAGSVPWASGVGEVGQMRRHLHGAGRRRGRAGDVGAGHAHGRAPARHPPRGGVSSSRRTSSASKSIAAGSSNSTSDSARTTGP